MGVANVMLVSARERRREIGIRRSFGATSRDIQRLFLAEATLLTLAGGIVGAWIGRWSL
jgi:putative ABC transport system permease protein